MKKRINGVLYDITEAVLIASYAYNDIYAKDYYCEELYQKTTVNIFFSVMEDLKVDMPYTLIKKVNMALARILHPFQTVRQLNG